jgi:hypothetical protein
VPAQPPAIASDTPPAALESPRSNPNEQAQLAALSKGPMPAPLRGSFISLQRQNTRLEDEGLERIEDQHDLEGRITHHLLVPVPATGKLVVNPNLPANRRYCRPWTAHFLTDMAEAHHTVFHEPLEVNSAVRTVAIQTRLRMENGNAAPALGDVVSPHLTGAAVDLAKDNLNRQEMAWVRRYLLVLQKAGKIDVEEEFQQACFHITVYKTYEQERKPQKQPAAPSARTVRKVSTSRSATAKAQAQPAARQTQSTPRPAPVRRTAPEPSEVIVSGQ